MVDKVSVTTRHSYGSRVKNSFWKIGWGFLLVILSIFLIFKNEQNFLQTKVALNEWAEIVKEAVSSEINPEFDQAEVHVYWETSSSAEALQDSVFWVIVDDLKLARNVSMYQWDEDSSEECTDNYGGSEECTTTYDYDKVWSDSAINSSNFYNSVWHENPTTWKYESQVREKFPIMLWAYTLDNVFVNDLNNYRTLNLSEQNIIIPDEYKKTEVVSAEINENNIEDNNNSYLYWEENTEKNVDWNGFYIHDSYIYIWQDETNPQIWDLKITFESVKTWVVSIVWKQAGSVLTDYTASNGKSIALLQNWQVSAEQMFIDAQNQNKNLTWLFRVLLLVVMFIGFSMIFEFITTLAKVLPFLSKIIGVWTGIIAFALTLVFGFLAIWISRLAVRPVVWISCLVVVIVWIVMLVKAKKNKKIEKWNDQNPTSTPTNDKDVEVIEA